MFAKKSLGQNFLKNIDVIRTICSTISRNEINTTLSSISSEQKQLPFIIEIGGGTGALTRELIKTFGIENLTVIEKDDRCVGILKTSLHANVMHCDVLECDWNKIIHDKNNCVGNLENSSQNPNTLNIDVKPAVIVGNLPYNISVPILYSLFEAFHSTENCNTDKIKQSQDCYNSKNNTSIFTKFVLMFQKEVAERITAEHGTSKYGKLSINTQMQSTVHKILDISPDSFRPAPKVWSSVIVVIPHKKCSKELIECVRKLTFLLFQQRRKIISGILKKQYPSEHDLWMNVLSEVEIDPQSRPEAISVKQYIALGHAVLSAGLSICKSSMKEDI
jgi:16S rRNA (adenine1518-N6/adenine1519-N6)-dimethyltransferase